MSSDTPTHQLRELFFGHHPHLCLQWECLPRGTEMRTRRRESGSSIASVEDQEAMSVYTHALP